MSARTIDDLEEGIRNLQILLGHAYDNNRDAYNQRDIAIDALKAIAANSSEDNEWDAVDKLHANQQLALDAISKAEAR